MAQVSKPGVSIISKHERKSFKTASPLAVAVLHVSSHRTIRRLLILPTSSGTEAMTKRIRGCASLLLLSMLVTCTTKGTKIWIEPQSTADHLVFRVGYTRESGPISLGGLRVDECALLLNSKGTYPESAQAMWITEPIVGEAPPVTSIVYGRTPTGYRNLSPARTLSKPGCYVATISGTGLVRFEVGRTGSIRELSKVEQQ